MGVVSAGSIPTNQLCGTEEPIPVVRSCVTEGSISPSVDDATCHNGSLRWHHASNNFNPQI